MKVQSDLFKPTTVSIINNFKKYHVVQMAKKRVHIPHPTPVETIILMTRSGFDLKKRAKIQMAQGEIEKNHGFALVLKTQLNISAMNTYEAKFTGQFE